MKMTQAQNIDILGRDIENVSNHSGGNVDIQYGYFEERPQNIESVARFELLIYHRIGRNWLLWPINQKHLRFYLVSTEIHFDQCLLLNAGYTRDGALVFHKNFPTMKTTFVRE